MKMYRFSFLLVFAAALHAQDAADVFNKPPAGVEEALRSRVTEFFDDHIKQQSRKAEGLVAEDTKEFYYSHNKPAYLSCEIGKITYSDNFTKAKVMMKCEQFVMIPGFTDKPLAVPFASTWKIEDGKWCWYVDPEAMRETPFGKLNPGPMKPGAGALPGSIQGNGDFLLKLITPDRDAVTLKPGQTEKVILANSAPGPVDISLIDRLPGVEATLDHRNVQSGGKAILTLKAADGARSGTLNIRVEQTGVILPIQITVQ